MAINKMNINIDENVERVAALPEEYVSAVEDIVGNLDSDWRNKLVYAKYIAYLCDVFEDAIKKGMSVEEVIGTDRKAYADKIQKELQFMDITPTKKNKVTNYLIILDFIMYIGMTVLGLGGKNLSNAQSMDYVLIGIGIVILVACIAMKIFKIRTMKNIRLVPVVQLLFVIIILSVLNYEVVAGAAALAFCVLSDFLIIAKQKN